MAEQPTQWMQLPYNAAYPNFKEFHVRDAWCEKSGCIAVCNPETVCCEGGRFDEPHDCRKQSAPAPSPASDQDEMERRAREFYDEYMKAPGREAEVMAITCFRPWDDIEFNQRMMAAFATQETAAERKRVLEEACKAVCVNCFNNIPVGEWCGKPVHWDVTNTVWQACTGAAIRKLEER